jgi:hypothetical protein
MVGDVERQYIVTGFQSQQCASRDFFRGNSLSCVRERVSVNFSLDFTLMRSYIFSRHFLVDSSKRPDATANPLTRTVMSHSCRQEVIAGCEEEVQVLEAKQA